MAGPCDFLTHWLSWLERRLLSLTTMSNHCAVKVYGASWCHDTRDTRRHLDELGIPYEYRDVDEDSAADAWVRSKNSGVRKLPTVDVGGTILSVPDEEELDEVLESQSI